MTQNKKVLRPAPWDAQPRSGASPATGQPGALGKLLATAKPDDTAQGTTATAWRTTSVSKTMWPPGSGTIGYAALHGRQLVCVRYRQDACSLYRYTTIELVVNAGPLKSSKAQHQQLLVPIAYDETDLRKVAKQLGAKWNPEQRAWEMSGRAVQELGLTTRAGIRPKK